MFEGRPLFSMTSVYHAYRRCRRRKRGTLNALRFEQNLEENLVLLHEELSSGRYRPGSSVAFLVEKPKNREIFAADFRDRVVHHILVGHLEPYWEKRFIHDSYACRKGKGTHAGMERLQAFARRTTENGTLQAWYLQLDVRGFFISLNRKILFDRLCKRERDPAVLWLMGLLVFHEPALDCRLRDARRSDFERLPAHRTLFKAAPNCGLPIGNLTSQFFANIYLDALDQYVKHTLKAHCYIRYCDDLVLLSRERPVLEDWEKQIAAFLGDRLKLSLNNRRKLRPVSNGIDFLGYIVRPDYLLVRRRVTAALRQRLTAVEEALSRSGLSRYIDGRSVFPWAYLPITEVAQWLNSYLGHIRKASCYNLIAGLRKRFWWLDEYFIWKADRVMIRFPVPRFTLRFSQQIKWFQERLPGHVLVIQLGRFYDVKMQSLQNVLPPAHCPTRFHRRRMTRIREVLWKSGASVAWTGETGRRLDRIAERALACRWSCRTDALHPVNCAAP